MAEITQLQRDGLYELTDSAKAQLADSKYYNEDLAPSTMAERTWNTYHISMLWVGMAICIPSIMMASGGVALGLPVWASVLNVILGNAIILVPIQLNSHAGTKYGIPFPIFSRLTFGMRGAHIPSISRAVTACGWNMVQSMVGGGALTMIIKALVPAFNDQPVGIQFLFFLIFMALCAWITATGSKAIRIFESFSSPVLIILIVLLLVWSVVLANGAGFSFGQVFSSDLSAGGLTETYQYVFAFLVVLTGNIAFWATMALNIPDFSRWAKNQKTQFRGQMYGMVPAMAFCAIVGAFMAQATFLALDEAIFDPVGVLGHLGVGTGAVVLTVVVGIGVIFATMTTNIAANIVAPANGFSNLAPGKIGYKAGVLIACIVSIVAYGIPFYFVGGAFIGFMFNFLNTYGAFLAPLASIFILDYYFIKKKNIDIISLYQANSRYWYKSGFNTHAIIAWVAGAILPTILGLIPAISATVGEPALVSQIGGLAVFAWINANAYLFSFFVAFLVYWKIAPREGVHILSDEQEKAITQEVAATA
ncbi:MAG: cytosine permease [Clostridiales bacterium]|nr:cytosine permease [Clostridiales bacterium]